MNFKNRAACAGKRPGGEHELTYKGKPLSAIHQERRIFGMALHSAYHCRLANFAAGAAAAITTTEPEGAGKIRERVVRARQKQLDRFATSRQNLYCNAQMSSRHIRNFCELSADCERLIERARTQQGLSAHAHDRILKVARTIADLKDVAALGAEAHSGGDPVP